MTFQEIRIIATGPNQYFHVQVPDILNSAHISILEMYAVYIALQFWIPSVSNKRLQFFCDNQACVQLLTASAGRDHVLLNMGRQIWIYVQNNNVQIKATYIPSSENRLADVLSRWCKSDEYSKNFFAQLKRLQKEFVELTVNKTMFEDIVSI